MSNKSLAATLIVLAIVGFSGWYIYSSAPKVPEDVVIDASAPDTTDINQPAEPIQDQASDTTPTVTVPTTVSFPSTGFAPQE